MRLILDRLIWIGLALVITGAIYLTSSRSEEVTFHGLVYEEGGHDPSICRMCTGDFAQGYRREVPSSPMPLD